MQKLCEPNIEKNTFYIKAMPILCKNSANRIQKKFTYFSKVQPILCKDNGFLRTLHICCDNSFMLK